MTTQQVLDKQGLQHYATKMCNAENRKVGSKSLPTALNDIDIAIDGFKTLFDNEYGTPVTATIKNDSNSFTVGVGNGIDKSNEVENSFTDITIKGNTFKNLCKKHNPINIKYSTTDKNYFQTGVNLLHPLQPSTEYTVILKVTKNNAGGQALASVIFGQGDGDNWSCRIFSEQFNNQLKGTGIFKGKVTTNKRLSETNYTWITVIGEHCNIDSTIEDIMILEGDWTNKSIPSYFEGLKSVGENEENKISILSFEKASLIPKEYFLNNKTTNFRGWSSFPETLDLKDVVVKFKVNRFLGNDTHIKIWAGNDELNGVLGKEVTMNCTTLTSIGFYNWNDIANGGGREKIIEYLTTGALELIILPNINHGYPFYPYFNSNKKDKKEILLNEPLRGLPGGAKDTIEKVNGKWKLIRRCREMILNGKENWGATGGGGHATKNTFEINLPYNGPRQGSISCLSDIFANNVTSGIPDENCFRCVYDGIVNKGIFLLFSPRTSLIPYRDTNAWKKWLSQNPVKVIYELETPIIEDIDPVVLQCWKGGNIFIDEVLPVESTHAVALNKTAQIQNNIEELTSLRNRVQKLEEQYNSTILTQAYQTILLNFDNDL